MEVLPLRGTSGLTRSDDRTMAPSPVRGHDRRVMGTRRQVWLEGLAQQRATRSEHQAVEPIEHLEPSDLSARIGIAPKTEASVARQKSPRSDGTAPWRKALRDS